MKSITILGLVGLIALCLIVGPLATIWALNTLFPSLVIPYSLKTWVAVVVVGAAIRANVSIKKD